MVAGSEPLALLFTDVVDSTQLNDTLGDAAMARLWAAHDQAGRRLIRQWQGREVGRSDGFFVLFDQVAQALGFALAYHAALDALALRARVGLHWGPALLRHNPPEDVAQGATPFEVDGLALPVAARVMSVAEGGQTLLSAAAAAQLPADGHAPRLHSHGHWRLKGVAEPVELLEAEGPQAPLRPPAEAAKGYRVQLGPDGLWAPQRRLPHNLPAERDAHVGRDAALRALAQRLEEGARLVTLLGIGGIGKTRLALRHARGWLGEYPGGAWFCDLSSAQGVDGIVHAVAQVLGVPLGASDPVPLLGHAIAARGDCLLILDNFEQVARHAEATLGRWLALAGQARFVVTSREVLGISGEHVQVLAPLAADEAGQLFRQRMRTAGRSQALSADDAAAIAPLVELLDRLPLALELAAARSRLMSPCQLLQGMDQRFRLLAVRGGRHDRQATLRATLDWSWELLSPAEQATLAQLSVFEGGFSLAAAEVVVDLTAWPAAPWVGDTLQALVEKSLLREAAQGRFGLLRSVQDYAAERLEALGGGAVDAAQARHGDWCATLDETTMLDSGAAELDNLVQACRRAVQSLRPGCAVATLVLASAVLRQRGPASAALALVQAVAALPMLSPAQLAAVLRVQGNVQYTLGHRDIALQAFEQGLLQAMAAGDEVLGVRLRCAIAEPLLHSGQPERARALLDEALSAGRRLGDDRLQYMALNAQGTLALQTDQAAGAEALLQQALAIAGRLGHRRWQGGLLGNLGTAAYLAGRQGDAARLFQQALAIGDEVGDRLWVANTRSNLGLLHLEEGAHAQARAALDEALHTAREIGELSLQAIVLCNLGLLLDAEGAPARALAPLREAADLARQLGDAGLLAQCEAEISRLGG